jgi:O-antigen/teichoic acid export membrane protein
MSHLITRFYYEKLKPVIKSPSFHVLFSSASVAFIFLLADFVFTRRFSQQDFGTWRQLMLIVTLGTTLISLGMPEGYRYFISFDQASSRKHAIRLLVTTFLIAIVLQVFLIAGGMQLIANAFNNISLNYFLYTIPVIFIIVTLSRAIRYLMINNLHTLRLYNYSIICIFISIILIGATWLLYEEITPAVFWIWMSGLITVIYLILFLPYIFVYFKRKHALIKWKEAFAIIPYLKVGFPLYIATFVGVLTLNLDKTIVSAFTDVVTFAIYSIGAIELPIVGMIGASISQKIFPQLVNSYKDGKIGQAKDIWINTTLKSTYITYPIILLMMIVSKPLVIVLFTDKYIKAVPVFQIYLLVGLWRNTQYGSLIIASGKTKWTLYYSILCLVFNIGLSLLLFYLFGVIGIAWGALLAASFIAILQLKHENLLSSWLNRIVLNKIILAEILAIFIVYFLYNQPWL